MLDFITCAIVVAGDYEEIEDLNTLTEDIGNQIEVECNIDKSGSRE